MARALTAARVRVAPEHEAEYLQLLADLAARERAAGRNLWLFRSLKDPRQFLEFSESAEAARHRSVAARSADELRLERRLRQVADYAPDAEVAWSEVALCPVDSSS